MSGSRDIAKYFDESIDSEINNLLLLYNEKKYDDAEALAISLTKRFSMVAFPWKILGAVANLRGNISDASTFFQRSAELAPQDSNIFFNLGVIYKKLGRLKEAEESYKKAISIKPNYANANNNLGVIYRKLDRIIEAEQCYMQAVSSDPNHYCAFYNLGIVQARLGKIEEAEKNYQQAILLNPNFGTLLCKGIWPPSKPSFLEYPDLDLAPLCPLVAVPPLPEPCPLPTLFLEVCMDPCSGFKLLKFIIFYLMIETKCLTLFTIPMILGVSSCSTT